MRLILFPSPGTPKRPMVLNFALSAYSGVAHNHYYAQFMRGKEFVPDSVFDVPSYCPDLAPGVIYLCIFNLLGIFADLFSGCSWIQL